MSIVRTMCLGLGVFPLIVSFGMHLIVFLLVIFSPTFLCVSDAGSPLPQFSLPHYKKWLLSIYLFIFYRWGNQSWERVNILHNIFSTCSQSEVEPEMDSGAVGWIIGPAPSATLYLLSHWREEKAQRCNEREFIGTSNQERRNKPCQEKRNESRHGSSKGVFVNGWNQRPVFTGSAPDKRRSPWVPALKNWQNG